MKISQLFLAIGLLSVLPAMGMMVIRDQHGFSVREGNTSRRVNAWDMDKTTSKLSKMDPSVYKRFVEVGGKLCASKMSNGDYVLRDHSGLKGGGAVGAVVGATVGFAAVNGAAYGTIGFVSSFFGPAAPFIAAGVGHALAPAITIAAHTAAISCGIALGTITGPI